jgi:hypothetical protein
MKKKYKIGLKLIFIGLNLIFFYVFLVDSRTDGRSESGW